MQCLQYNSSSWTIPPVRIQQLLCNLPQIAIQVLWNRKGREFQRASAIRVLNNVPIPAERFLTESNLIENTTKRPNVAKFSNLGLISKQFGGLVRFRSPCAMSRVNLI